MHFHGCSCSRRQFIVGGLGGLALTSPALKALTVEPIATPLRLIKPVGPGARYVPKVAAAFVRRKGDYGILWPGAIYDGEAALKRYQDELVQSTKELGIDLRLRSEPIYSLEQADQWLAEAKSAQCDGLMVILLDRQAHAWPTAAKAGETKIPTLVFSPIGTSFTTNTAPLAKKEGIYISSTSDFKQMRYGLRMIKASSRLREMRFVVLKGDKRYEMDAEFFGTRLRYLPAKVFLDEYNSTSLSGEIKTLAADYVQHATGISGPSEQDVLNGIKSYVVARNILEREEADGITMDCLGALGKTDVSLPCIAWSKMLDHGIPAACEADIGAALTHALVQFLFDRPGFQQDPVAETDREGLIGAHCTCPTMLNGFNKSPEPFDLSHHHGNRDAVPRPKWRLGQRVTVADILLPGQQEISPVLKMPQMVIASGTVMENISVPPAGGCVVSVMLKMDGTPNLLTFPGFHQLFFYGDFKKHLLAYCQLTGIQPLLS